MADAAAVEEKFEPDRMSTIRLYEDERLSLTQKYEDVLFLYSCLLVYMVRLILYFSILSNNNRQSFGLAL